MKIAMLGHKRIPSREGGIEIVVEELATRMAQLGHDVTCYNRKGKHVMDKNIEENHLNEYKGVHIKPVFTIDKRGLSAMSASFFASIKAAFSKADVVHFHAEGPCATLWIPKLFGKRCIATIHGLDHQRAKWGKLASTYIMMGEKCAVKHADEIIVLSKGVQEYFKETYGRKTVFIPNGVNKPKIVGPNLIQEKFKLNKDDYILYLGRIVPEKGIHYLIEAYNQIKTDKKLVIAGGSSDTDEYFEKLKEMAKNNKNIIFTGFVQGQILDELYSNAYIYCLPSDLEGMPLSLLEAMSYGNCCLVSDIEECTSVIEDKAHIFNKSDIQSLKDKIQELLDKPKLVQGYKSESTYYICNKYNWDNIVNQTLILYKEKKNDSNSAMCK
ncbi:glycosyltransferase family 4 protein [Faecalitalea cylindroides]|uniref:glycosyltransferase family 4 protein n=1 Tax=Faecalitalea cylindroides TaxID=39483 RepID=UPI001E5DB130|nr:glycosyltransferase family 4 protein [Faecalitalea cylindroides]MDB7947011.1 glycosyltransferase family 4 protein [Faecalitalea cylindroides]MDB7948837.1 glycosyltransferase family 4 protein [Faecalitalea cylindroides]MDB7950846.1 glycosyltransferase family 4 protein [Faecalitalea cylindroides]